MNDEQIYKLAIELVKETKIRISEGTSTKKLPEYLKRIIDAEIGANDEA